MRGAVRLSGSNRDTACVTAVLISVIYAVLYVAFNSLDVLRCITFTLVIKLFVFHFLFPLFLYFAYVGRIIIGRKHEFIQKRLLGRERI